MRSRLRSIVIIGSAILITLVVLRFFHHNVHQIDDTIVRVGIWGPLFIVCLYTVLSLTPVPTDPITIMIGALYGPLWGLTISWTGNTAAAILEYFIAHHLGSLAQFDKLRHKLPWGLSRAPVDSVWFLTLGRVVPGFGSKVVSIMAGLYHVPLKRYVWTTALMTFLGCILYVIGGHFFLRG